MSAVESSAKVTFFIRGPFRIEGPDGVSVNVKSRKAQAILALLVTTKSGRRGRAWVQDKLWSDRGAEQGAGSLRQALSELRRCFRNYPDLLNTNRSEIWLDTSKFEIATRSTGLDQAIDLFEGLDVRDNEFDTWLTALRIGSEDLSPQLRPQKSRPQVTQPNDRFRQIIFHLQTGGTDDVGFIEEVLCETICRNLRENGDFDIHMRAPVVAHQDGLIVEIQCFAPQASGHAVRISVMSVSTGQILWSEIKPIPEVPTFDATPEDILAAGTTVANQILRCFLSERQIRHIDPDANVLALIAMQKIFLLRPEESDKAEAMLNQAFEKSQRGVYRAWLAQLNTISFIEGFKPRDAAADDAERHIAHALELEGENSQVLTIAANCALVFDRDPSFASHLARSALRANPANAMAWWVLGHVQLYVGRYEESYAASNRGQRLAHGTFLQYWLDFQAAFAASFCDRLPQAQIHGQAASILRPEFRAAHRFSIALNAATGDIDRAADGARKLAKLEQGFSASRMITDESYPISLLRATPFFCSKSLMKLDAW